MKIIVGLGNPGKQYQNTRHNVGWMVVDRIFNDQDSMFNKIPKSKFQIQNKFKSEIAEGAIGNEKVILVKPITFMNLSGEAVGEIYRFYKDRITLSDILVVHDDADLELGRIKVQKGGASAGHHGVESIIKNLGTSEFNRVRIGVRTIEGKAMEFVLKPFSKEEQLIFDEEIRRAAEAVQTVVIEGIEKTMNKYN